MHADFVAIETEQVPCIVILSTSSLILNTGMKTNHRRMRNIYMVFDHVSYNLVI